MAAKWRRFRLPEDPPSAMSRRPPPAASGPLTQQCSRRLLPGEGDIDLQGLFAWMLDDVPINIEVPNDVRALVMGHEVWAWVAVRATQAVLEAGG
jgi:hypothetical protein